MKLNYLKRTTGYLIGTLISVAIILVLAYPSNTQFHAHGPMNVGHEKLKCGDCHIDSVGTFRQQVQANAKYFLGLREEMVTIGFEKVGNSVCIHCHYRPTDNHPVYRFMEPKFSEVRAKIQPQICISCHAEHMAKRVTIDSEFCKNCHGKLHLKKDILTPTHASLVKNHRWKTCLGCHDYHGNHRMNVNEDINKIISDKTVNNYFDGSQSPYSTEKKYKARRLL